MINLEIFLMGLLISSTLTSLITEAIKIILVEINVKYYANMLAGIVSLFTSAGIGVSYVITNGLNFDMSIIVCLIAQVVMGWLCAMIGYDKVIQAISQFKTNDKESDFK